MPCTSRLISGLCAGLLGLAATSASAGLVSYRFDGVFTNPGPNDPVLVDALQPVLGNGAVRIDVSYDPSTPATLGGDGQLARAPAITGARMQFSGFSSQIGPCANTAPDPCSVSVANDVNELQPDAPGGYDTFSISSGRFSNTALEAASGLGVPLRLRFSISVLATRGNIVDSLDLGADLLSIFQTPMLDWSVALVADAPDLPSPFGAATFNIRLNSITALDEPVVAALPEPGAMPLLLIAAVGALASRRCLTRGTASTR